MNIIKRLSTLSVVDLHGLQREVLDEIQRRRDLSCVATTGAVSLVGGGQKYSKDERSVAVSKPAPVTARPVSPRSAA